MRDGVPAAVPIVTALFPLASLTIIGVVVIFPIIGDIADPALRRLELRLLEGLLRGPSAFSFAPNSSTAKAMSADVNGVPLFHFSPSRSLNV